MGMILFFIIIFYLNVNTDKNTRFYNVLKTRISTPKQNLINSQLTAVYRLEKMTSIQ